MKSNFARITSPLVLSRTVNWESIQQIFNLSENQNDSFGQSVTFKSSRFFNSSIENEEIVNLYMKDCFDQDSNPKEFILMGPYPDNGYILLNSDADISIDSTGAVITIEDNSVSDVIITQDPIGQFANICFHYGHIPTKDDHINREVEVEDGVVVCYTEPETLSNDMLLQNEWETRYILVENHIDDNASFDGAIFDISEDELNFVKAQNPNCIWTYQDDDNGVPCITSGFHVVNRLGYFITEKPWLRDTYVSLKHS